jgi:hypothetical protein
MRLRLGDQQRPLPDCAAIVPIRYACSTSTPAVSFAQKAVIPAAVADGSNRPCGAGRGAARKDVVRSAAQNVAEQLPTFAGELRELHLSDRTVIVGRGIDCRARQAHRQHEVLDIGGHAPPSSSRRTGGVISFGRTRSSPTAADRDGEQVVSIRKESRRSSGLDARAWQKERVYRCR